MEDNVMRHSYKSLSEQELQAMKAVKDLGLAFYQFLDTLQPSREISLAKTKIEEAVMWGTKHITK